MDDRKASFEAMYIATRVTIGGRRQLVSGAVFESIGWTDERPPPLTRNPGSNGGS